MKSTGIFSIGWKDLGKALIMAFLGAFVTSIYTSIQSGALPNLAQLKTAGIVGASAAISYIIKNFLTNNNDQFVTPDKPVGPN